jgi:hypothetical protein
MVATLMAKKIKSVRSWWQIPSSVRRQKAAMRSKMDLIERQMRLCHSISVTAILPGASPESVGSSARRKRLH